MNLNQLRDERDTLATNVRSLLADRSVTWTDASQALYDRDLGRIDALNEVITREQESLDLIAGKTRAAHKLSDRLGIPFSQASEQLERQHIVFNRWCQKGEKGITEDERGVLKPIRNTLSVGTNSQGGYTVPTTVVAAYFDALKAYGGMRQAADVFPTDTGATMNYPTSDGTSETGELVAENASAAALDPSFGVVSLPVYKYSSKVITVPYELLQDSLIDVEALIRKRIVDRLGRIQNSHFTNGTGSSQPRGVVTGATLGKTGASGQTAVVIHDDLVDLEHSLDQAYRANAKYMMADSSVKVIRKVKDGMGRPIFVPGYEQGTPGGAPAQIFGREIIVNNDVPAMAASATPILFGDFSNYKIRDVMDFALFRFDDSAYVKNGQVGFLAWLRSGGTLVDVSGTTIRYYQNAAS